MSFKHVNELRFDIDVLIRYHDRRRAYYDLVFRFINGITVLAGSAAAVTFWAYLQQKVLGPGIGLAGALIITVLNAYSLVSGITVRAREHDALYRRYVALEERIVRAGQDSNKLREWEGDFLLIERDELPIFRAIYVLCQNEATDVWKLPEKEQIRITFWQSILANFMRMPRVQFSPVGRVIHSQKLKASSS